jgi:16S rRNA (cytidine1402-2'-O)-methyltransferase
VTDRPLEGQSLEGQPGGGRLFVVATPIGNLGDITLRALEVLESVPLIGAEDTRISRRLLERYKIRTRTMSFHARNAFARIPEVLAHLRTGAHFALITDAGTPGVSDPGEELVRAWAAEGGLVVPLPGASAVLAAVASSGIAGPRWSFEGFLPRSGRERRERLARIAGDERTTILFEAPGRVAATLADLAAACGPERPAALCRELTKVHEEIVRGPLGDLAERARAGSLTLRGEFVVVVGKWHSRSPGESDEKAIAVARSEVERLVAGGVARGEAARRVADSYSLPRRILYEAPDRDSAAGSDPTEKGGGGREGDGARRRRG